MMVRASLFLAVMPVTMPELSYSTAISGLTLITSIPPSALISFSMDATSTEASVSASAFTASADASTAVLSALSPPLHPVRLERPINIASADKIIIFFFIRSSLLSYKISL